MGRRCVFAVYLPVLTVGAHRDVSGEDIDDRVVCSLDGDGHLMPQVSIEQGERLASGDEMPSKVPAMRAALKAAGVII
jgi:hypothetical protein